MQRYRRYLRAALAKFTPLALLFIALVFISSFVYTYTRTDTQTRVYAATSSALNFQARLFNNSGGMVADGSYNIEFKLYTASEGGTAVWTETRIGTDKVRIVNGYLSVGLGDVTAFPSTVNWDQDHWLTMNIGGSGAPVWDGEMTPRLKLTAVPYAFQAKRSEILNKMDGAHTGILDFLSLTANRNINLPDQSGTLCIQGSADCVDISTTGDTALTSSNSGLEIGPDGLRLLGGCSEAQFLRWNEADKKWECYSGGDSSIIVRSTDNLITASSGALEFGPTSNSNSEFIISNQGGGVTRIRLGNSVLTNGNYAATLDTVYVNENQTPAPGDITGSFSTGFSVNSVQSNSVNLGTDTTGDYIQALGSMTGLSITGTNSGEGATPGLSVNYGSLANTSVQGNTQVTCSAGGGDLSGGGTVITLGAGGTCGTITISEAPVFDTSVTTPLLVNSGAITISAAATAGADDIIFSTAGSEKLRIVENGSLFFEKGTNDITITINAPSGAPATYTFDGSTGTVLTTSNFAGNLDGTYVNENQSLVAGDLSGSYSSGFTINADSAVLGTDTVGDYIANLGTLTGLSTTGNSGEGSTPGLSVLYGSGVNNAAAGSNTFTCASGSGNLSGGGTVVTIGASGTACAAITTNDAVVFTTSVTSPLYTGTGAVTISSGGSGGLTLDSASNTLLIAANDTGLRRTAAGSYTIDLNNAGATTLILNNSGTGAAGLNLQDGGLSTAGTVRLTNAGALQNVTGNNTNGVSFDANTITSGTLVTGRGGTGMSSFTANGILYASSTSGLAQANGSSGQILLANGSGVPTFTTVSGDATISSTGVITIGSDKVALGTDTTGDYIQALGSMTGLSITGTNSGEGATPGLSVNYGSLANTSVQGNTQVTCSAGGGDLSGGGTVITLGAGGTCGTITISEAPVFDTSVTSPLFTSAGALTVSSTGSNDLTLTSGSGAIALNANSINTTSGLTYNLSNAANTSFTITNSGAGLASLNVEGAGTFGTGLSVTSGGATVNGVLSVYSSGYHLMGADTSLNAYGYFRSVNTSDASSRFEIGAYDISGAATGGRALVLNQLGGNVGIGGDLTPDGLLSVGSTSQFQVSAAGAVTAVGLNSGTGLVQGTGGLSIAGAISLNGNISDPDSNLVLDDTVDLGSSVTGLRIGIDGSLVDIDGNIVLNDQLSLGSATTGLLITTDGVITDIDDGTVTFGENLAVNGNTILGDASTDSLTINGVAVSTPNGLNFDNNTLVIDSVNNRVAIGTATANAALQVQASVGINAAIFSASSTLGNSNGVYILAGTNSSDYGLQVVGAHSGIAHLLVKGDGTVSLGSAATGLQISTAGIITDIDGSSVQFGENISILAGGINNNGGGITGTGAIAGVTTINATGLATISGGVTITGNISLGNGSGSFALNSSAFDVSTAGALSGITSISASGNISTTGVYVQNGNSGVSINCGSNNYLSNIQLNGGIITGNNGCRGVGLSDERLKENVVSLETSILDKLKDVRTVNFDFKCDDPAFQTMNQQCETGRQTGVIAQELAQVFPELVYQDEFGYYRVKYDALSIYNLKAVSEISKHINSSGAANFTSLTIDGVLEAGTIRADHIEGLEYDGRFESLEARVHELEQQSTEEQAAGTSANSQIDLSNLEIGNLTANGAATFKNTVEFEHGADIAGDAKVAGNTEVQQLTVNLDLIAKGSLEVTGPATFKEVARFEKDAQFDGQINVLGYTNLQGLTVNLDLIAKGSLEVTGPATFKEVARFEKDAQFDGNVAVKGQVTFSSDTAGHATIKAGEISVKVSFAKPKTAKPVITLTLGDGKFAQYSYKNVTEEEFEIVLLAPASEDLTFSWAAISADEPPVSDAPITDLP